MSKTTRFWLVFGIVLFLIGAVVFVGAVSSYDWDFSKLSTTNYTTNTLTPVGEFDKIDISVNTADVKFEISDDDNCKIVCHEEENNKHSAEIENRTLFIKVTNTKKWYNFVGISFEAPKMTVYLPKNSYETLSVKTSTGDVNLPKDFSFGRVEIDGDTSDVNFLATVSEALEIKVTTGDVKIADIATNRLILSSSTGDMSLEGVSCSELDAESDTGKILLEKVIAEERIEIKTDTGDVCFEKSDAQSISVETDTGDVFGSLLSEKIFFVESDTGRIDIPKTSSGGKCEISTDTGDVRIEIIE